MGDEIVIKVDETVAPASVAEQASQIIETAEELAEKMSRRSEDTTAILGELFALRELIVQEFGRLSGLVVEEAQKIHDEIFRAVDVVVDDVVDEVDPIVKETIDEIPSVEPTPVEVPVEELQPEPAKKPGRKWL